MDKARYIELDSVIEVELDFEDSPVHHDFVFSTPDSNIEEKVVERAEWFAEERLGKTSTSFEAVNEVPLREKEVRGDNYGK